MVESNPLEGPPAVLPARFDLRVESQYGDEADRPRRRVAISGGLTGLGLAILFGILGALRGIAGAYVAAACMGALGAGLLLDAYLPTRKRAISARVDARGVSLEFQDGTRRIVDWSEPRTRLLLADYHESSLPRLALFRRVPCMLSIGRSVYGLSYDAFRAIRESAVRGGISVVDSPPLPGGRAVWIGDWPKLARPTAPRSPYEK